MDAPRRSFVFAPRFNQPPDKANPNGNDATGAFQPGMAMYKKLYEGMGGTVITHLFDNSKGNGKNSRLGIINAMAQNSNGEFYDAVVYFGHGDTNYLVSPGFSKNNVTDLTNAIDIYGAPGVQVILYACSCAASGGIAYSMADSLSRWAQYGMRVLGHTSAGHSFMNPQVRIFPGSNGLDGVSPIPPGRVKAWNAAMMSQKGNLWARFPFMSDDEIAGEVG